MLVGVYKEPLVLDTRLIARICLLICEMADRLEAGSKIFTTPINLSHWMVALMSPTIKKHLRAIDRIKVSGVPVPMTVYTFDIFNYKPGILKPRVKDGRQAQVDFFDDEQYSELQDGMDPMFLTKFREGYDYYILEECGGSP